MQQLPRLGGFLQEEHKPNKEMQKQVSPGCGRPACSPRWLGQSLSEEPLRQRQREEHSVESWLVREATVRGAESMLQDGGGTGELSRAATLSDGFA